MKIFNSSLIYQGKLLSFTKDREAANDIFYTAINHLEDDENDEERPTSPFNESDELDIIDLRSVDKIIQSKIVNLNSNNNRYEDVIINNNL